MIGLWKEPKCSLLAQAKIDAMQLKESVKKQNMQKCSKGWKDGRWRSGLLHRAQSWNILASKIRAETAANKLFFRLSYFSIFVSQGTRSLLGMLNIFAGLVWLTQNKSGKCAWVVYEKWIGTPIWNGIYVPNQIGAPMLFWYLCFWNESESVPRSYFLYYQASWHCTACLELPWSWKLLPHRQAFLQCLQLFNSLGCHCLQFFALSWAHTWFESGHRTVLIKFSLWQSTKFRTFVWDSLRGSDSIHYCVLEVFQTVTYQKALFVQNITLVHIRRLQVNVHHFPTFAKKSQQKYHIWG